MKLHFIVDSGSSRLEVRDENLKGATNTLIGLLFGLIKDADLDPPPASNASDLRRRVQLTDLRDLGLNDLRRFIQDDMELDIKIERVH